MGAPEQHPPVIRTDLNLPRRREGKVRDVYDLPPDSEGPRTLLVATDRLSAFDVVLPTPIRDKGVILTSLASWWLRWIESRGLARTHLLSTHASDLPAEAFANATVTPQMLEGRVMICRSARVVPVECVVRGYLDGSGWADYQRDGAICGIALPPGLRRGDMLPEPIFTPSTKAQQGDHDAPITFEQACEASQDPALMGELRDRSLQIYREASAHALARGVILADTKFEWGVPSAPSGASSSARTVPILIDEALTPDSSRFWRLDRWKPGAAQESFDKQFVREYLQSLVDSGAWDKSPPGPTLPPEVVTGTLDRYREALRLLTT